MAHYLDSEQPVYGIQSPAFVGKEEYSNLAERAIHYIEAIKSVHSKGPCFLAGMSYGENMAVEMAIQLKNMGDDVGFVALLDSYPPRSYQDQAEDDHSFLLAFLAAAEAMFGNNGKLREVLPDNLQQFGEDELWNHIIENVDSRLKDMINQEISQQLFTVWKSHHAELKKHISQIYSGHIILFQANEKLPNDLDVLLNMNTDKEFVVEGWNNVASKPMERILVPGNHFTLMDEPNIRILSEFLKVIIKRWEPDKIPNQSSSS